MSKLSDEIIEKLFTDWKGNRVPRLIQADTNGCGWGEHAVRAIIEAAEQSVYLTASGAGGRKHPAKAVKQIRQLLVKHGGK